MCSGKRPGSGQASGSRAIRARCNQSSSQACALPTKADTHSHTVDGAGCPYGATALTSATPHRPASSTR